MWTEGNIVASAESPFITTTLGYETDRGYYVIDTNHNEAIHIGVGVDEEPKEKPKKDAATVVREYVQRHRALFGEVTVESKVK